MAEKKKIAVIYYYTPTGKEIVDSDFNFFFKKLIDNEILKKNSVTVFPYFCPDADKLNATLKGILGEDYEEFFLHFSGHGYIDGIPLNEWVLKNDDFASMVENKKVKSCFFSSCQSSELVKAASHRKIPIVIGTSAAINIDNGFAIQFQKRFYNYLAEKENFRRAFELAYNDFDQAAKEILNKDVVVYRAEISLDDLEAKVKNELQIVFSAEEEKELCLIYPTVVEEFDMLDENKQTLFVYAKDDNILLDFKKIFYDRDLQESNNLLLLSNSDLLNIDAGMLKQRMATEPIKLLFIVHNAEEIFKNDKLKELFDKKNENAPKGIYENDDLKFSVLVIGQSVLDLPKMVENSYLFKNVINDYPVFKADSFEDLFEQTKFDAFINEIDVGPIQRKNLIWKFPCKPTREEVLEFTKPEDYIRVFFADKKYENLINYIINWLYGYKKMETPIIISDFLHQQQEKTSVIDALIGAIQKAYEDNKMLKNQLKSNLSQALGNIFFEGHIIVVRTDIEDGNQLKTEIKNILEVVEKTNKFDPPPKIPTFIFFVNHDKYEYSDSFKLNLTKTKTFNPPDEITAEILRSWTDILYNLDDKFDKIIDEFNKIDFSKYNGKCPSEIIKLACSNFKIPPKKILYIS